ncbi:hypothetical protein WDU94_010684 [Cyamophila willieti]
MIKLCRAYRTTSTVALQVLSKSPPIELLVEERAKLYHANRPDGLSVGELKSSLREELMEKWQRKWNAETQKGQWTKRLIKNIEPWVKRKHGDLTYRMTQALTGHGCFGSFLKRIGKESVDNCHYCSGTDTPDHTMFHCVRFDMERRTCCLETGCNITPDNIVPCMLENQQQWNRIARFLEKVMLQKEADERTRQTNSQ